ncbi:SigE family RNA polymerase sigma factor [Fodinicola acaciae]|uniref:SigE family RNA polymerase sigma factor n=1 Tax=Fodinicola acaciae TaxID=2681555 RepID=UPI0013D8202E|nr:SigE family RNA polymerase sigma factor [Fodinicola acaciae]
MEFTEYVRAQRPALMRFATVLTGQPWLADDLVSDVLGRAFERWPAIGAMDRPHAYVRRMVVNEHLSWRRRLRRTAIDRQPPEEAVADGAHAYAERDAMIALLARLPRRQRAAVVLRYYVGLSDTEVAAELGCRESTVRSQISRALRSLRIDIARSDRHVAEPVEQS